MHSLHILSKLHQATNDTASILGRLMIQYRVNIGMVYTCILIITLSKNAINVLLSTAVSTEYRAGGSNSEVVRPRGRHYDMLSTFGCVNAKGTWGQAPPGNLSKLHAL